MRIQSIAEANTQQQQNPFLTQKTDSETAGKSVSIVSFKECLRSQILDFKAPAATRKAELVAASPLWSYLTSMGASPRPELKLKERASAPLSDI